MSELLDSTVKKVTVHDGFTNLQDRIRHFFIDGLIVLTLSLFIQKIVELGIGFESHERHSNTLVLIRLMTYMLYYSLMEYFLGYTLGKWLNKTRVVSINENKPTFGQILIRTITRLIPIGFLTIFSPYTAFLHDLLSQTRTMRIKKKKVLRVNEI